LVYRLQNIPKAINKVDLQPPADILQRIYT
jgi:hypothetical protein